MRSNKFPALFVAMILLTAGRGYGYIVMPAVPLDQMVKEADLVVKATAVSIAPAKDPALPPVPGYLVVATQFKVISVIKGDVASASGFTYRHYASDPAPTAIMYTPQYFDFAKGRSYLVFAKKIGGAGMYRQLWVFPTADQTGDALLAADDQPVAGHDIKAIAWKELTHLAASADSADVLFAINRLNVMSEGWYLGSTFFDRARIAEVVRPMLSATNPDVVSAAIRTAGSDNPFTSSESILRWYALVGKSKNFAGCETGDVKWVNVAGKALFPDLARIADDSAAPPMVRASAIRALGRCGAAELPVALDRWSTDREPAVRQAAIVLLGDVPTESARKRIAGAVRDDSPKVRSAAADAIGIGQTAALAPMLAALLDDPKPMVRDAAVNSLLSLDPAVSSAMLRANLKNPEYHELIVIALARADAKPYIADLEKFISAAPGPGDHWLGTDPAHSSWHDLFAYVQAQPAVDFYNGKLTGVLDSLEKMSWMDSGETRNLYALYVQHALPDRAKAFRARRDREDPKSEVLFKQVDSFPGEYPQP